MLTRLFKRKRKASLQDNLHRLSMSTYELALEKLHEGQTSADVSLNDERKKFFRAKQQHIRLNNMRHKIDNGLALNDLESLSIDLIRL